MPDIITYEVGAWRLQAVASTCNSVVWSFDDRKSNGMSPTKPNGLDFHCALGGLLHTISSPSSVQIGWVLELHSQKELIEKGLWFWLVEWFDWRVVCNLCKWVLGVDVVLFFSFFLKGGVLPNPRIPPSLCKRTLKGGTCFQMAYAHFATLQSDSNTIVCHYCPHNLGPPCHCLCSPPKRGLDFSATRLIEATLHDWLITQLSLWASKTHELWHGVWWGK